MQEKKTVKVWQNRDRPPHKQLLCSYRVYNILDNCHTFFPNILFSRLDIIREILLSLELVTCSLDKILDFSRHKLRFPYLFQIFILWTNFTKPWPVLKCNFPVVTSLWFNHRLTALCTAFHLFPSQRGTTQATSSLKYFLYPIDNYSEISYTNLNSKTTTDTTGTTRTFQEGFQNGKINVLRYICLVIKSVYRDLQK